jgi:hypothetical protein
MKAALVSNMKFLALTIVIKAKTTDVDGVPGMHGLWAAVSPPVEKVLWSLSARIRQIS